MKVVQLIGVRASGKTSTVEILIKCLKEKGYRVGTIKMIGCPAFSIEKNSKSNTKRHADAGADVVIAAGVNETAVIYKKSLDINEMLKKNEKTGVDFCIVEGGYEYDLPRIVCARSILELESRITDKTFCLSGVIANEVEKVDNLEAISALSNPEKLVKKVLSFAKELSIPVQIIERPKEVRDYCSRCKKD